MHSINNIENIEKEIALIKEQLTAAQLRLAALESLLRAQQAAQQVQDQQQAQQAVQQEQQEVGAVRQPKVAKGVAKGKARKARQEEEEINLGFDANFALAIMDLIAERGELRVSVIRWRLANYTDHKKVSEADVIYAVKVLERLEALRGTWVVPGIITRTSPVLDPWIGRGPRFDDVRRRLQERR